MRPVLITRRIEHRFLDVQAASLDEAVAMAVAARDERRPLSIGVLGNAAVMLPELLETRGADRHRHRPDLGARPAVLPAGRTAFEDCGGAGGRPGGVTKRAQESMAAHVRAMVEFQDRGRRSSTTATRSATRPARAATTGRSSSRGSCRRTSAAVLRGKGPFRWAALSGDLADIAATDRAILELFPDNERLRKWITMAGERVVFQGLPARICWLGYGERHLAGLKFNEMVASGELSAPIVIGRDHLDCGSVASPYRETEAMLDGSDAIADWPLLNALVNTASGASWVSIHHGGGVGMGRSIHAGQVRVADGTSWRREDRARADQRPGHGRDPARGRRYEEAVEVANAAACGFPCKADRVTKEPARSRVTLAWNQLSRVGAPRGPRRPGGAAQPQATYNAGDVGLFNERAVRLAFLGRRSASTSGSSAGSTRCSPTWRASSTP